MTPSSTLDGPESARPRRPRAPAEVRRREILDAARRLFAEKGFHGTTTRDLSRESDLNDALLYRYFGNKEEILTALIDQAIEAFHALPIVPPDVECAVQDLLLLAGAGFLHVASENLDLLAILIKEHGTLGEDRRFVQFVDGAATALGAVIDRLQAARGYGAGPVGATTRGYLTARAFFGSLLSFLLLQRLLGMDAIRPVDADDYLQQLATQMSGDPSATH